MTDTPDSDAGANPAVTDARRPVGIPRTLATLALVIVVIAGVRAAAPVLQPTLIALFLAIGTSPVLSWCSARAPRSVAIGAAIALNVLLVAILFFAVGTSFSQLSSMLPRYSPRFVEIENQLLATLATWGIEVEPMGSALALQDLFGYGTFAAQRVIGVGSATLLVLLIVAFIFLEAAGFQRRYAWLRRGRGDDDIVAFAFRDVQVYLGLKTLISAGTGLAAFCLCWTVGVPLPLFWGTLAFLLNFIPFVGSFIASVPPLILALLELGSAQAMVIGVGYLAINITFANIVEPRVFGKAVKLSPLAILLGVLFWGWVLGPVGALIAVPIC
ncbi:MAG: AI-2E family transporter [Myxococcota bacterium]